MTIANKERFIIEAAHVQKTVMSGDKPLTILHNINLQVKAQASVAILGTSGSGKTTLLSILAGLDSPSYGQVFIDQQEITELSEDGRAAMRLKNVGFIFQSFQLLPSLSALENVMLPLELSKVKNAKSIATDWLQRVGLEERIHHLPKQLSGGEQQRVSIARAFAIRPKILFADEPTGNLDKKTSEIIIKLLFSLNAELGTTLIIVTHNEQLAARCNEQVVIDGGTL